MALRDRYDSDGVLAPGPERYRTDERIVCDPWQATLPEIEAAIGSNSTARRALFGHLRGFLSWLEPALSGDERLEVWVRGVFASTLAPEVEDLDLVVHYGRGHITPGDRWILGILAAGPVALHPYRLIVTSLCHDGLEYAFERDEQAWLSRMRTRRAVTKEQVVAGWIRVIGEKGDG